MKAKKLVLLLDVIIVAIITLAMMTGTTITKLGMQKQDKLLAENSDLSFNLIASPEEARVKAGETVEITLSVEDINIGKTGLNSIVGFLGYNESLFDSVEITAEESKGWNIELNKLKEHKLYGKFCIYTMQEGVTENQNVVKMKMKLKDDLKPQTTKVRFTNLASSDGDVEVPEEDRVVTIIIYEEGSNIPDNPDTPEKPDNPDTPQTGDRKILVVAAIAILTIVLNVLVFAKGKKGKVLSALLVMVVGLSCLGVISYAKENIDVERVLQRLNIKESWLNSDDYLVTDENISRIAPGTSVGDVKTKFNKSVIITNNNKEINNGIIGTGMKISVKNPTAKDAEGNFAYEVSVWGDTNGDGKSNQVELTRIIRNVVNKEKWNLEGALFKSADLTVDNKIDKKDVNASVKYIVYEEMEIPEFDPVEEPTIEIVEGTYDEEFGAYTTDVKVKITEVAQNGIKTQYKVENSRGLLTPYTQISRENGKTETIITLAKDEIYKVSAYTTGELGNRSEIPNKIICGIYDKNREYKVEYYYKALDDEEAKIDDTKTETGTAEIGNVITTYTDKNIEGYAFDKVEGLPLTIRRYSAENIIKVYYKQLDLENPVTITGYVKIMERNGIITDNSENGGTMEGVPETVEKGGNSTNTIIITPKTGYKVTSVKIFTKNEEGIYDIIEGEETKTLKRNGIVKITKKITNVTEDKHVVAVVEQADIVAKIVGVPGDDEGLKNIPSLVDGQPVFNHEYTSLADALKDAENVNDSKGEIDGFVEIQILKDIDGEINDVKQGNDVIIDLNGKTVSINEEIYPVLTVTNGAQLIVVDRTEGTENEDPEHIGTIKNGEGSAVKVEIGGSFTIGEDEGEGTVPSAVYPIIQGGENAIFKDSDDNGNQGIFNFYDGQIIGDQGVTLGGNQPTIDGTPIMYSSTTATGEDGELIATLKVVTGREAQIGDITYEKLEDAFNAVKNNPKYDASKPVEIEVIATDENGQLKQVIMNDEVVASKNIVLDLNGRTVRKSNNFNINDGATLTIIDSAATKGVLEGFEGVINKGTIIVDGAVVNNLDIGDYANERNNSFILNNGTVSGKIAYTKNVTINGGTFEGNIGTNADKQDQFVENITVNGGSASTLYAQNINITGGSCTYVIAPKVLNITGGTIYDVEIPKNPADVTGAQRKISGGTITQITVNKGTNNIIEGNAIVEKNVTINNNNTELTINNETIGGIVANNSSKVTINNGTIGAYGPVVANDESNILIKDGTVECVGTAINVTPNATITLGVNDHDIKSTPLVKTTSTTEYAITGGGTLNFFDGNVIASIGNTLGNVQIGEKETQDEDGNEVDIIKTTITGDNSEQLEKAYLGINTEKLVKINSSYLAKLDLTAVADSSYNLNGDYYEFNSLENAIKACKSNEFVKMILMDDNLIIGNFSIPAGKNIEIDFAGHDLQINGVLTNNGSVTYSNSESNSQESKLIVANEGGYSEVIEQTTYLYNNAIINNGNMTVENVTIPAPTIVNNEKLVINSGVISDEYAEMSDKTIINKKTLEINGGTITSSGRCIYNEENGTVKMTAGTISSVSGGTCIENHSNVKYVNGTSNGSIYITGGETTAANNSNSKGIEGYGSGDIRIVQSQSAAVTAIVNMNKTEGLAGDLYVIGVAGTEVQGSFVVNDNTSACNATFSAVNGTIEIGNNVTANIDSCQSTVTVKAGAASEITNSNIATLTNYGDTQLKSSVEVINGIQNGGNLTLGIKGDNNGVPSDTAIIVKNERISAPFNGISNTGNIYFYDGKVISRNTVDPIDNDTTGVIADFEDGYEVTLTDDGENKIAKLEIKTPLVSIPSSQVTTPNNGYKPAGENTYYFYNFADAFSAAKAGENVVVTVVKDNATISASDESGEIPSTKQITLDLNGKSIEFAATDAIINKGTLTIQDTSEGKTGEMKSTADNIVSNEGTLTVVSGKFGNENGYKSFVENTGTLNITTSDATVYGKIVNEGTATITQAKICNVTNTGTATLNGVEFITKQVYESGAGYMKAVDNSEDGKTTIVNATVNGTYVTIINNTTTDNANAGVVIKGDLTGATITNRLGLTTLDGATISTQFENHDKVTLKNGSTVTKLVGNAARNQSNEVIATNPLIRVESGTIAEIGDVSNSNLMCDIPIMVGLSTDNITDTNAEVKLTRASGAIEFNSGKIKQSISDKIPTKLTIPATADLDIAEDGLTRIITLKNKENEAQIVGGTAYPTLKQAVQACGNEVKEIELLKDIYITTGREVEIGSTQNITIDLQGFNVYKNTENDILVNNGTLTVKSDVSGNTGKIDAIVNNNQLTIDGLKAEGQTIYSTTAGTVINSGENAQMSVINDSRVGIIKIDEKSELTINNSYVYQIINNGTPIPVWMDENDYPTVQVVNNSTIEKIEVLGNVLLKDSTLKSTKVNGNVEIDNCSIRAAESRIGSGSIRNERSRLCKKYNNY